MFARGIDPRVQAPIWRHQASLPAIIRRVEITGVSFAEVAASTSQWERFPRSWLSPLKRYVRISFGFLFFSLAMPKQMPSELLSRVVGVRSFRLIFATDAREAMINNIEDIFIVVKISWMKTKVFPRWRLIDLIFDIFISLAFFFFEQRWFETTRHVIWE